jgi:hypothetical protein
LDLLEITLRRNDCPASAHDRLSEEGRNGVGSLLLNEHIERLCHARGKFHFGLARLVTAVVMGEFGVLEVCERQAEARVHIWLPGQTDCGTGVTMVSHLSRDDLSALRLTNGVPIVPGKLNGSIICLRA